MQLILTYLIIAGAILYTLFAVLKLLKPRKSRCSGCCQCKIKDELRKKSLTPLPKQQP